MSERIYFLLLRKLTKEASNNELHEFESLLELHPEVLQSFQEIEDFWNQENKPQENPELLARHLERLTQTDPSFGLTNALPQNSAEPIVFFNRGKIIKVVAIAATITLILISTYWVFTQTPLGGRKLSSKNDKAIINEVRTHPSSRTKIVLPDGTQVWVNSASRLLYNPDFGLTHRKVVLNGEAYFIVSKNKDLPFEIETKRIAIKVTGTTFNVRAYDDENKAETSLFEGSVQVKQNKVPEKVYFMKPNQKLVINEKDQDEKREELLPVKKSKALSQDDADKVWMTDIVYDPIDSLALETAWVFSTFAFYNESFQELALKMGKWYGVEIIFQSKNLENIRFTGRFTTETVAEALEALQFTAKFRFKRDQEKIFIY